MALGSSTPLGFGSDIKEQPPDRGTIPSVQRRRWFTRSLLEAWIVSTLLHFETIVTGHWVLSMPGIALATFGLDMSFAAAAVFITSSMPRPYQGTAESVLVTLKNIAMAVMTSVSDLIGVKVDGLRSGEI